MISTPESSNIEGIDWEDGKLTVQFRDGSMYQYSDVSSDLYQEFVNSPSKGQFFRQNVKGVHEYIKVA
jgi:hypothetical protein